MKNILLIAFSLLFSFSGQAQIIIENGGFEEFDPSCPGNGQGIHDYAFEDGCLTEGSWECYSMSPGIHANMTTYGSAFEGNYFAHMAWSANPNGLRESIHYTGVDLNAATEYDFSMAVKCPTNSDPIGYRVVATVTPNPDCGASPTSPGQFNGVTGEVIASGTIDENDGWVVVNVNDFVFDAATAHLITSIVIHPVLVGPGGNLHLLVDGVSMVGTPCELKCMAVIDSTACAEEGDYGFINLQCQGGDVAYDWTGPFGNTALEGNNCDDFLIYQLSEGTYSVTATDWSTGCISEDTFEVVADCCVQLPPCELPAPTNLRCGGSSGNILLAWDPVPGAAGYQVSITTGSASSCFSCFGPGGLHEFQVMGGGTQFSVPQQLGNCFRWSVKAICENGGISEQSAGQCFSLSTLCTFFSGGGSEKSLGKGTTGMAGDSPPQFFPNPTGGDITFSFSPAHATDIELVVMDASGKTIYTHRENNVPKGYFEKSIPIAGLTSSGIYFVKVKAMGKTFHEKVVVSK